MCSIAPAPAALGFDTTAFLHRRRGVAAVAPTACAVMARDPVHRVGAVASSAPTKKRARDGFDGNIGEREGFAAGKVSAVPAPGQQRLQERTRAELDAIRVLHRKAVLLCRGAATSGSAPAATAKDARFSVSGQRPEAPMEAAAKRRKTTPSKPAPEAKKKSTEAVKQQQQRPIQRATLPTTKLSVAKPVDKAREIGKTRQMEENKLAREKHRQDGDANFSVAGLRRKAPLEAAAMTKKTSPLDSAKQPENQKEAVKQQARDQLAEALIRAKEVQKRRLMEEIAQASEKCRQEVLEIERTALPDETIYQKDLEELGIFFQYTVTRTWRQAHSDGSR